MGVAKAIRRKRKGVWRFLKRDLATTRRNQRQQDREARAKTRRTKTRRTKTRQKPATWADPTVFLYPYYFVKGVAIDTIYYGDKVLRGASKTVKAVRHPLSFWKRDQVKPKPKAKKPKTTAPKTEAPKATAPSTEPRLDNLDVMFKRGLPPGEIKIKKAPANGGDGRTEETTIKIGRGQDGKFAPLGGRQPEPYVGDHFDQPTVQRRSDDNRGLIERITQRPKLAT